MPDTERAKAQDPQTTIYIHWLKSNRELLTAAKLQEYPYLYKMLIANHDAIRRFLIALTDVLIREAMDENTYRLPDRHGCIPVMLTEHRLKDKLKFDGMEFSPGSQDYTWDIHDKLTLLHSVWLIKRVIAPSNQASAQDDRSCPKYVYADLYTLEHLARVEDRVRRWAIVTGRRQKLSKDDCIWLYGQHDADLIFIPSTRTETTASLDAVTRFYDAYLRAKQKQKDSPIITIKAVQDQLWAMLKADKQAVDTYRINDICHRAKIPLYIEYGLQNRQLTRDEKAEYGIADRTAWGIMSADAQTVSEMRSKRS